MQKLQNSIIYLTSSPRLTCGTHRRHHCLPGEAEAPGLTGLFCDGGQVRVVDGDGDGRAGGVDPGGTGAAAETRVPATWGGEVRRKRKAEE